MGHMVQLTISGFKKGSSVSHSLAHHQTAEKGPDLAGHSAEGMWGREAAHPSVHTCPLSPVHLGAAFILGSW